MIGERESEGYFQFTLCPDCKKNLMPIYKIYPAGIVAKSSAKICINVLCLRFINIQDLKTWTMNPFYSAVEDTSEQV